MAITIYRDNLGRLYDYKASLLRVVPCDSEKMWELWANREQQRASTMKRQSRESPWGRWANSKVTAIRIRKQRQIGVRSIGDANRSRRKPPDCWRDWAAFGEQQAKNKYYKWRQAAARSRWNRWAAARAMSMKKRSSQW